MTNGREIVGNWNEYQRLVLAELERHNVLLQSSDDRISNLKLEIDRLQRQKTDLESLQAQVRANTEKINGIVNAESVDDALKKYRNWVVGLLFVFVTALLIPVVNLLFHTFGGGG